MPSWASSCSTSGARARARSPRAVGIFERFMSRTFDRSFKRVYAMRPEALCDSRLVPVWNLQRAFRLERARAAAPPPPIKRIE